MKWLVGKWGVFNGCKVCKMQKFWRPFAQLCKYLTLNHVLKKGKIVNFMLCTFCHNF
jgi:hypothetical protein